MDGFHLDNRVLIELGLLNRKGAINTFDSAGFVDTVKRIRSSNIEVVVPVFDRDRDIAIAGAQRVQPTSSVILFEGNYLLVNELPWSELKELFDISIFINPDLNTIEQRILERWRHAELSQDQIEKRTYENDLPNAEYVVSKSDFSDSIQLDPAINPCQFLLP